MSGSRILLLSILAAAPAHAAHRAPSSLVLEPCLRKAGTFTYRFEERDLSDEKLQHSYQFSFHPEQLSFSLDSNWDPTEDYTVTLQPKEQRLSFKPQRGPASTSSLSEEVVVDCKEHAAECGRYVDRLIASLEIAQNYARGPEAGTEQARGAFRCALESSYWFASLLSPPGKL